MQESEKTVYAYQARTQTHDSFFFVSTHAGASLARSYAHANSRSVFRTEGIIRQTCYGTRGAVRQIRKLRHEIHTSSAVISRPFVDSETSPWRYSRLCVFPTDSLSLGCFVPLRTLRTCKHNRYYPTPCLSGSSCDSLICIPKQSAMLAHWGGLQPQTGSFVALFGHLRGNCAFMMHFLLYIEIYTHTKHHFPSDKYPEIVSADFRFVQAKLSPSIVVL